MASPTASPPAPIPAAPTPAPASASATSIESEYEDLQRKCRTLEANKKTFLEDAQKTIEKQRIAIDRIKRENKKLQEELTGEVKGAPSTSANFTQQRIAKLQEIADNYARKIDVDRRQLEDIEKEIEIGQAKAEELRRAHVPNAAAEGVRQSAKSIKVLENRLETTQVRFNELLAKNKELRATIEAMNKERQAVDQAFLKLQKEIDGRKAELAQLGETVSVAQEMKAACAVEVGSLKAQNDKEQAAFEAQIREMQRCMEADQKLLAAQQRRINKAQAAAGGAAADDASEAGGDDEDDPAVCESAISKLREATGISDMQALVTHLAGLEDSNFKLFESCNHANERIGQLQKEVRDMQFEIRQLEVEGVLGRQKDIIRQALGKRESSVRRQEQYREKQAALERRLALVQAGLTSLIRTLLITPPPQPALPEGSFPQEAQRALLLSLLAVTEAKARAITAVYRATIAKTQAQMKGGKLTHAALGLSGPSVSGLPGMSPKAAASARHTTNDDDDDDDDVVPLTRAQIQSRTGLRPL